MEINDILTKIDEFFASASSDVLTQMESNIATIQDDVTIEDFFAAYSNNYDFVQTDNSDELCYIPSTRNYGMFIDAQTSICTAAFISSRDFSYISNPHEDEFPVAA